MNGTGTSNKVIHLILTSGNVAPYRWEYTYWNNGSNISGWISWLIDSSINTYQTNKTYTSADANYEQLRDDIINHRIIKLSQTSSNLLYYPLYIDNGYIYVADQTSLQTDTITKSIVTITINTSNVIISAISTGVFTDTVTLTTSFDSRYLQLSGGTLIGSIKLADNAVKIIDASNHNIIQGNNSTVNIGDTSSDVVLYTGNFDARHIKNNASYNILDADNTQANPTLSGGETSLTALKLNGTSYKIENPVTSVNTKTGAVVLTASDIDTTNNQTIQQELNGKYEKPSTGIPASDIAAGVIPTVPSASTSTPLVDGTASAGSSSNWSRGDHVHPTDTTRMAADLKGTANGVAELDANGKVPSSQLPSYVDDVLEYTSVSDFPATGETGKIYVATSTNLTYRWGGSTYVEISPSLALGETSSTAYAGDKGKEAHDLASAALPKSGGTMTGAIAMGGNKVTGLGTPTADADAATKKYVDDGLSGKQATLATQTAYTAKGSATKVPQITTNTLGQVTGITEVSITDNNTWRAVKVNGTEKLSNLTSSNALDLTAGTNVTLTESNGVVTIAATDTTYESKAAAQGGTAVSLVTTGEKYVWNNKQNAIASTTATLEVASWSSNTQTVSVAGVTTSNNVIVSPSPASTADYANAGVYCSAQGSGTLTFTCSTTPTVALTVNVMVI